MQREKEEEPEEIRETKEEELTSFFWSKMKSSENLKDFVENTIVGQMSKGLILKNARRSGRTWLLAYISLKKSLKQPYQKSIIITYTIRLAQDICEKMSKWMNLKMKENQRLRFKNGSTIECMSIIEFKAKWKKQAKKPTFDNVFIDDVDYIGYAGDDWESFVPKKNIIGTSLYNATSIKTVQDWAIEWL